MELKNGQAGVREKRPALAEPVSAERMLDQLVEVAGAQLEREQELPTLTTDRSPQEVYQQLGIALGEEGLPFDAVAAKLGRVLAATPSSASRRYFNQLFGGRDPMATLAEMLTPLMNTSMYTYKAAGPQVLIEKEVLRRMAAKVGFEESEGMLSAGGSLSNLAALLVARNEAVPAARDEGLGTTEVAVYTSAEGHYSIPKNAAMLGLGRNSVRKIAVDGEGRMEVAALARTIEQDVASGVLPLMVNATAGTTVAGAYDPLSEISEVARRYNVWLHVDGAFGGTVLMSRRHRHLLAGCELADSFTWDAHKMMGVPLICSALLLRRRGLLIRNLDEGADYLFQSAADELNPGKASLQCGRRNDALKLWAAWQVHGDRGYEARVDRCFELARHAVARIEAEPQLSLVAQPQSINVCFEVRDRSSAAICDHLDRQGRLKIGHGRVDGRRIIRLVCVNPELGEEGVDRVFDEILAAAAELPPEGSGPEAG